MKKFFSKIWEILTKDSSLSEDADGSQQYHSRLLATLLIIIIPVSLVLTIFPGLTFYGNTLQVIIFLVVLVSCFLLILGYVLNLSIKNSHVIFAIVGISSLIVVSATLVDVNLLPFLVIPLLLSAIFLSIRSTVLIMVVDLIGGFLIPTYVFGGSIDIKVFWMFVFILVSMFLILNVIRHRNRLERNHRLLSVRSEAKFRSISKSAREAIITIDSKGDIISWNKAAEGIFAYSVKEIVGKTVTKLSSQFHKNFPSIHKIVKHKNGSKKSIDILGKTIDIIATKKDGSDFPLEISFSSWRNPKGTFYTILARDISNQKEMARNLQQEKNRAQIYLDIAKVIIVVFNKDLEVVSINKTGGEVLGYNLDEITGEKWVDKFVASADKKRMKNALGKIFESEMKSYKEFESSIITKNGKKRLIHWRNATLRGEKDNVIAIVSSGEDVTDSKEMERKLKLRNRELERLNQTMIGRELAMAKLKKKVEKYENGENGKKKEKKESKDLPSF